MGRRSKKDREDHNQDQTEPKDRHGDPEKGSHHGDIVDGGIASGSGNDPDYDPHNRGEDHREEGQFHGGRKELTHLAHYRSSGGYRLAEVEAYYPAEVGKVLLIEGTVETHLRAELRQLFRGRAFTEHDPCRIAG